MKNTGREKLILVALALSLAVAAGSCSERITSETPPPTDAMLSSGSPSLPPDSSADTAEPTEPPVPETPEPTEPPVEEPGYTGPDVPLQDATEDSYFEDAAFLGNSLVDGLRLYGGIDTADYYAATSASVVSVGSTKCYSGPGGSQLTLLDALAQEEYAKVYVLLGINEIGFDTDYFISLYSEMLDSIRESQPEAEIYVMSLTPVTREKSDEGKTFSMERVSEYNQALYRLAADKECYFVDLVEALEDGDGFLAGSNSTDGVHLKVEKYHQWADYLRCHYLPDPEGSKTLVSGDEDV